mmetsp:Transcript_8615/g.27456  ORF Transcript_8615/g.27456 Transcript_8615/m.27456 type:complete len:275 (+) Transcript_8615:1340-2164(+)
MVGESASYSRASLRCSIASSYRPKSSSTCATFVCAVDSVRSAFRLASSVSAVTFSASEMARSNSAIASACSPRLDRMTPRWLCAEKEVASSRIADRSAASASLCEPACRSRKPMAVKTGALFGSARTAAWYSRSASPSRSPARSYTRPSASCASALPGCRRNEVVSDASALDRSPSSSSTSPIFLCASADVGSRASTRSMAVRAAGYRRKRWLADAMFRQATAASLSTATAFSYAASAASSSPCFASTLPWFTRCVALSGATAAARCRYRVASS